MPTRHARASTQQAQLASAERGSFVGEAVQPRQPCGARNLNEMKPSGKPAIIEAMQARRRYANAAWLLLATACGNTQSDPASAEGGSGGSPDSPVVCTTRVGPLSSPSIDDFEDGDAQILQTARRHGFWYANNDGTGTQAPPSDPSGRTPLRPSEPGSPTSPNYALRTVGWGFSSWGAFISANLASNEDGAACPYDVSAYSGLTFNAKGAANLRVTVGTRATVPVSDGGECSSDLCSDYGSNVKLTSEWAAVSVPFDALSLPNWASPAPWAPGEVMRVSFWVPTGDFDFWVDDVSFY